MNEDRIIDLLKVASAYDSRKPDREAILAWLEASRRACWNFHTALDAIHEHYAKSPERIMPGHITDHHRKLGGPGQPAPVSEVLALRGSSPASAEHRAEVMAQVRDLTEHRARRAEAVGDAERPERRPEDGYTPETGEAK